MFLADNSQQIESIATVGDVIIVLGFSRFVAKQGLFGFFEFMNLVTTNCKFVSIGFTLRVFEDVEHLVVFILSEVAIGEQASGLFGVFFGDEAFCEEGGVGGDVVVERVVNGLDELVFEESVVLGIFVDHI